jgi:hypothetical protein
VGLALALGFTASCGDDGNGTGPVVEGDFGVMATALEGVMEDYFTDNQPALRSIDYFADMIAAALGAAPLAAGPMSSGALLQSCLSPDVAGTTFDYDAGQGGYVPTTEPGAPADGARFLLYEVSSGGTLVSPPNQFGYLDFDCPMVLPTVNLSIEVTVDGVQVIAMYATGTLYPTTLDYQLSINVDLQTPDGSSQFSIPLLGVFGRLGTRHSAGYTIQLGSDVYVSFSRHDYTQSVEGTFDVFFQAYEGYPDVEWEATAELIGTSSSSISGPVIFMFPTGSLEAVACLSGSYMSISASRPTQQCAGTEFDLYQDLSNSELDAIERAYAALRSMLDTMDDFVQVGFSVIVSSVG